MRPSLRAMACALAFACAAAPSRAAPKQDFDREIARQKKELDELLASNRKKAPQANGALDKAARHIFGHRVDDVVGLKRFGDDLAAVTAILDKSVGPLIATHRDVSNHIDPQPWRVAMTNATVEKLDIGRNIGEQRVQGFVEQFKAGELRIAQIDDDAAALRTLDTRRADGVLEPRGLILRGRRSGLGFASEHG